MMSTFHAANEDAAASADSNPNLHSQNNIITIVNKAGNSNEDQPQIDTNPTIVLQDTDSECEGYHSSDFEFITESDAGREGIIAKQQTISNCNKSRSSATKRTNLANKIEDPNYCKMAKSCGNEILLSQTDSSKIATSIIQSFGRKSFSNTDSPIESKMATPADAAVVSRDGNGSFITNAYYSTKFKMATSSCENNSSLSNVDSPRNSKIATPVVSSYGTRSYYRGLQGGARRCIPEGQSYIDLFLTVGRSSTGSIENKVVTPPACMSVGRELGFDMRTMSREKRHAELPQLKREARGSAQKILEIYPEQNSRRRY